jgi:Fe-S oxidoreductase
LNDQWKYFKKLCDIGYDNPHQLHNFINSYENYLGKEVLVEKVEDVLVNVLAKEGFYYDI